MSICFSFGTFSFCAPGECARASHNVILYLVKTICSETNVCRIMSLWLFLFAQWVVACAHVGQAMAKHIFSSHHVFIYIYQLNQVVFFLSFIRSYALCVSCPFKKKKIQVIRIALHSNHHIKPARIDGIIERWWRNLVSSLIPLVVHSLFVFFFFFTFANFVSVSHLDV